jgi:hypothetical protein
MFLHVRGIVTYQQKISVWCVGQLRFRTVKSTERRVFPKRKYFQSFPGAETQKKNFTQKNSPVVLQQRSTLPAPRRSGTQITLRGFSNSPLCQEGIAHACCRYRRAPQARTCEPYPPVPTHILDPQYHLRLVTPRFDARARKRHDCTTRPSHMRTGDKQLFWCLPTD